MCLKIRCDGESEKFCKIFWELNKALVGDKLCRGLDSWHVGPACQPSINSSPMGHPLIVPDTAALCSHTIVALYNQCISLAQLSWLACAWAQLPRLAIEETVFRLSDPYVQQWLLFIFNSRAPKSGVTMKESESTRDHSVLSSLVGGEEEEMFPSLTGLLTMPTKRMDTKLPDF